MAYQTVPSSILIFGGFDRLNRTQASFIFNTSNHKIVRQNDLPTVGSFSTMVYYIEECLYTVGWNNSKKNLYKYNIPKARWSVDDGFPI